MQRHAITSNKMQSHSIAKTAIPSYILKWKDPGYRSLPMFMDFPPNFSLKTRKLLREGLENRNNGFRPLRGYPRPPPLSKTFLLTKKLADLGEYYCSKTAF